MDILDAEESDVDLIELQGEVENMEAFDGRLNKELVQLEFGTCVLHGRKIDKEFNIIETDVCNGRPCLKVIKKVKCVYLFDKPPRYRSSGLGRGN
ncbi:uncharacterized protein Eint_090815 [Encephalitozoon intestinalis ATCC 50506]|uniref:Uncharacterized protein n=1 Tax=Encephalitozoon intestinalis (strain ATCC 50506) TaxID=876142 RepID=W8Q206_ENCIT|nr:uncharacterized protein Eint_090815 [Encephalitozoon intestinalis ATCC 50506]AHL30149.1 hypothetical protein Eint_090815 [Encephalitozoon intestinalis ATCC 50506]UTX46018.1 hypothetical protein GPK93_09g16040 [Encephalitozoon intestinalis]